MTEGDITFITASIFYQIMAIPLILIVPLAIFRWLNLK